MKHRPSQLILYCMLIVLIPIIMLSPRALTVVGTRDSDADREALLAFKSMLSDPHSALSSWNLSVPHCHWSGVSCTNDSNMRVQSLSLPSLGLGGILPSQLSNLTALQNLDLHNNSFRGAIPPDFGRLLALRRLILAGNFISRSIPRNLSRCRGLEVISFDNNNITGFLPSEFGSLSKLKFLSTSMNNLTGSIPTTFGNLSALSTLSLARNQLAGELPRELGNLHNLATLQLSENKLSGKIPSWIFNISSLKFVSLTQNELLGELPSSVNISLSNLTQLYLSDNMIGGPLPSYLFDSSDIQALDLSSNQFHGTIPSLGNMKSLKLLHLGYNNLSSTMYLNSQMFNSLTNCTKLEILYLNANELSGELPTSVGNLSVHLKQFCVDDNNLTGSFPEGFERYQNLTALSIFLNSFTGKIPDSFGKLYKLQRLLVSENNFGGEIPDFFGNLSQLYDLRMGNNRFSGSIPTSIANCKSLSFLGLASNALNRSIPEEIFGLKNLRTLILAGNEFNGPLPSAMGSLKQLEVLDVSNNRLSGNISNSFSDLSSLRFLSMAINNLTGVIPKKISQLSALESLDLSSNHLSGSIPEELKTLQVLRSLNLSFNDLEGQVPRNGVFVYLTWDALQGNHKLCAADTAISEKLRINNCPLKNQSNKHRLTAILIPVSVSVAFLCAVVLLWLLIVHKNRRRRTRCLFPSPHIKGLPVQVSYEEIRQATNGFAQENFVGKGEFGSVYKAMFHWGNEGSCVNLAVKVIDLEQSKASKSFSAECEALKHARHRNLIKILTSCSSIDHVGVEFKALVMEFMGNGNLDRWLYPKNAEWNKLNLSLTQRINIAIDIASAMDYLHHDCDPPVVHCDLKPGNVLLDDNMVAHVGDFGLARLLFKNQQDSDNSTIGLKGSIGYIPPEYGMGCRASTSGDVYSFGILLLELVIAKRPTDEMFKEGLDLNKFASATNENQNIFKVADARLFENDECSNSSETSSTLPRNNWTKRSEGCVAALVRLGLSCAAQSARDRLTVREALISLHKIKGALLGSIDYCPSPSE